MKRISILALAAAAALSLTLSGCGLAQDSGEVGQKDGDVTTLTVGTSVTPHGDLFRFIDENLAADAGLKIEVKEFTDYSLPNRALSDGELDANYFQHLPYLESEIEGQGYKLHHFTPGVHLEPFALYSKKIDDIADLPDGATIGINNDPANQGRALKLLADNGIISLGDADPITATIHDVAENPKNLEFIEAEAASLARTLDDTDASVINGNNALNAGLSSKEDGVLVESPEDNPYANILVVREGTQDDPAIQKLHELTQSQEVKDFIEKTWPKGEVIPAS
ncbi:MetQ/NlpA family ABC transporter substrate-binding protein [Brevibacterium luteolum]|uniref:MetQ/NlpA family ABC transporter substrate-binding protein n=1 Tax=Brevibacterium luteolum TaxID=199591 RepID=UPI00223B8669|nr:MetQ/NlpA family ABC transporter substrate-binding protein [Brevibacterium luteolum]MCT1874221.1 MetQ/NlpA family ABC transporter substrate-binding protein [Brevibacterium luteolum]MCT1891446.1 MetQ/NlpA family ABC transporter substrate-binding protein [Brevibacterium luteolum]MCT1893316.1 MetQ/NlpA family ABC transporter substrate-binding protein [Brevibacterium luteolum]MCT1924824.1 MetQ/NlpA family ABC transporter substrate-binding protein [Brevibacterium luteolum]